MGYDMSIIEDNGYFIFDGIKSSDYGVWINGRETFNAPARRYNEYVVPGRNGTLTIDGGSFEDQEVTYPAFIVENFGANIEAFRNQLMTKTGYVRMTDSYHPDEYYLAKYMSCLEANVLPKGVAGSFDLTFKRDPRRFLISGETLVTFPPGQIGKNLLPSPYYHPSRTRNGITYTVNENGSVSVVCSPSTGYDVFVFKQTLISDLGLNEGDEVRFTCGVEQTSGTYMELYPHNPPGTIKKLAENEAVTITSQMITTDMTFAYYIKGGETLDMTLYPMVRMASDPDTTWTPYRDGTTSILNPTLYDSNPLIRVTGSGTLTLGDEVITVGSGYSYVDIDSEIQNCYCGLQNANSVVSFGSGKFPTLKPGITGISHSSGITSVQITPRWYRL